MDDIEEKLSKYVEEFSQKLKSDEIPKTRAWVRFGEYFIINCDNQNPDNNMYYVKQGNYYKQIPNNKFKEAMEEVIKLRFGFKD